MTHPVAVLLVGSFLLVGCSSDRNPTAPAEPGGLAGLLHSPDGSSREKKPRRGFYPLEIGNRWAYSGTFSSQFQAFGDSLPDPPEVFRVEEEREITGTEVLFGREYVVEEHRIRDEGVPETFSSGFATARTDRASSRPT